MLGSDSSWADPVIVDVDAALEDNVDHVLATDLMVVNLNASFLPSVDHFLLAKPLTGEHHTVVRRLVEIKDVLKTEFDVLVDAAKGRVTVVDGCCEVSL